MLKYYLNAFVTRNIIIFVIIITKKLSTILKLCLVFFYNTFRHPKAPNPKQFKFFCNFLKKEDGEIKSFLAFLLINMVSPIITIFSTLSN